MNERITPWFGVWSPELKGVQKMDDENHEVKWWHRLLRLSWLLGIAVFCFLPLVFIPSLHSGINVLLSTLGSTSLVVWLLAGTVDWWLKKAIYAACVQKRILQQAAAIQALTCEEVKYIRAYGINNTVEVIPNGLNPQQWQDLPGKERIESLHHQTKGKH